MYVSEDLARVDDTLQKASLYVDEKYAQKLEDLGTQVLEIRSLIIEENADKAEKPKSKGKGLDPKTLNKMIEKAMDREQNDDHLTDEERQALVDAYESVYPGELKDKPDLTEKYMEIIS